MAKLNIQVVLSSFYFGQGEDRLVWKRTSHPKENILSYWRISHESVAAKCWAFPDPLSYDGFLGLNSFLIQNNLENSQRKQWTGTKSSGLFGDGLWFTSFSPILSTLISKDYLLFQCFCLHLQKIFHNLLYL